MPTSAPLPAETAVPSKAFPWAGAEPSSWPSTTQTSSARPLPTPGQLTKKSRSLPEPRTPVWANGRPYRLSTIAANQASAILANNLQIRLVDGAGDGAAGMGGGSDALSPQLTSLGISHQFVPSQSGVTDHSWFEYHETTGATGLNFHFACFATASPRIAESITGFTFCR